MIACYLAEQTLCLKEQNNDLEYKFKPFCEDLFDYHDYYVDTLHIKLKVFDIIRKDILDRGSLSSKYKGKHLVTIERKTKGS